MPGSGTVQTGIKAAVEADSASPAVWLPSESNTTRGTYPDRVAASAAAMAAARLVPLRLAPSPGPSANGKRADRLSAACCRASSMNSPAALRDASEMLRLSSTAKTTNNCRLMVFNSTPHSAATSMTTNSTRIASEADRCHAAKPGRPHHQ